MPNYIKLNSQTKNLLNYLKDFWLKRNKFRLATLFIATLLFTALSISYPLFFKKIIDGISEGKKVSDLNLYIILTFAFGVGAGLINWFLMSLRGYTNMQVENELRNKIFRKLTELQPSYYIGQRSGDIITRATDDLAEKLSWFCCSGVFRAVQGLSMFVFVLIVCFKLNPILAICSIIPLPIIGYFFVTQEGVFNKKFKALQESISNVNDFIEACFSGIRVLKACNEIMPKITKFDDLVNSRIIAEKGSIKADVGMRILCGLIIQLGLIFILFVGGVLVIQGKISLGTYIAFNTYNMMLIEPLWNVSSVFVTSKRASISYERVLEILNTKSSLINNNVNKKFSFNHEIEFKNVSYSHNEKSILSEISFKIKKGEKLAIVGEIGAGKSTLVNLLMRLEEHHNGEILIDGVSIRDFELKSLRQNIGLAPQDPLLFSDIILNNISFYRENVKKDDIEYVSKIAQLDEEIEKFESKYLTKIGQRGVSLSGGQRQRTSLARALINFPPVLVLDDITSAMDSSTEDKVWQELRKLEKSLTMFIISHRTSTIEKADKILILKNGRIVEYGTHNELMAKNGYYIKFREKQLFEEKNA